MLVQMSGGKKKDNTSLEMAVSVVIAPHQSFVRRAWKSQRLVWYHLCLNQGFTTKDKHLFTTRGHHMPWNISALQSCDQIHGCFIQGVTQQKKKMRIFPLHQTFYIKSEPFSSLKQSSCSWVELTSMKLPMTLSYGLVHSL